MAMQTIYLKEHEGLVPNTIGQLSSVPSGPWWSAFGSQSVFGENCGKLKPLSMEQPGASDELISTKHAGRGTDLGPDKGNPTQFIIFPGNLLLFVLCLYMFLYMLRFPIFSCLGLLTGLFIHLFNHFYQHGN